MNYFEQVKEILYQYKHLGEYTYPTGTKLIGRVPHVAPMAWLHLLFPPLIDKDIKKLEKEMKRRIPEPYKDFLLQYGNGISIFSDSLNLYGLRKMAGRSVDAAWQPYSLITPNTFERPKNAKDEYILIGGYGWDGSKVYINANNNKVYYCARWDATPLYEWNSFEEMLLSEVKRIQTHFDSEGKRLDKTVPVIPITTVR